MPSFIHFDIPAENTERAQHFYADLFDWKIEKFPGPIEYYLIETTNLQGEPGLGGGITKTQKPGQGMVNFVQVSLVDEYQQKVEQLGGKVIQPKTTIPGVGYMAVCQDTENNTFGLLEVDKDAQ